MDLVLLMGGNSSRLNIGQNKVLLSYQNMPLFKYIILKLKPYVDDIILVIRKSDEAFVKDNLKGFQYKITYGGDERYLSVLNGLKLAKTKQVMIHDGARPFVDLKALEELLTLTENEIGMLYGNVKETIYLKDNKLELLNRASLIAAKTPQIIIKDLYQEASKKAMLDKYEPTDDISLILKYYNDINVKLVLDDKNVKITVKDDLKYLGGDFIKC